MGQPLSSPHLCTALADLQTGHNKGVSAIRLFPRSGHLLLSASMDTKIKLWDVYHEGNCLRTFMGHSQAVKDVTFNNAGDKFLSASYDRYVKQWDTETGQCIQVWSNGKIPNVVKYNPDGDKQNIFLAGMQDKKIIQVSPAPLKAMFGVKARLTSLVRFTSKRDCPDVRPTSGSGQHHHLYG